MILLEARYCRWKQVNIITTLSYCIEKSGKTEMNKESNLARRKKKSFILLNDSCSLLSFLKNSWVA